MDGFENPSAASDKRTGKTVDKKNSRRGFGKKEEDRLAPKLQFSHPLAPAAGQSALSS